MALHQPQAGVLSATAAAALTSDATNARTFTHGGSPLSLRPACVLPCRLMSVPGHHLQGREPSVRAPILFEEQSTREHVLLLTFRLLHGLHTHSSTTRLQKRQQSW